jgi:hypothetical protein
MIAYPRDQLIPNPSVNAHNSSTLTGIIQRLASATGRKNPQPRRTTANDPETLLGYCWSGPRCAIASHIRPGMPNSSSGRGARRDKSGQSDMGA